MDINRTPVAELYCEHDSLFSIIHAGVFPTRACRCICTVTVSEMLFHVITWTIVRNKSSCHDVSSGSLWMVPTRLGTPQS